MTSADDLITLAQACIDNPESADAWFAYGLACFEVKDYRQAVTAFCRAVEIRPSKESLVKFGEAALVLGMLDIATQCAAQADPSGLSVKVSEAKTNIADFAKALRAGSNSIQLMRREYIPYVLNRMGLLGDGVEIGVQEGCFSEHLLQCWNGKKLTSIDPWREFGTDYNDKANVTQSKHDGLYIDTLRRLMPFGSRSVVWRLTSQQASELVAEDSLDFCYIDGDHSYEGCSLDISLWYPKLKSKGILAGHDFIEDGTYRFPNLGTEQLTTFGVRKAVLEFSGKQNLPVFTSGEGDHIFRSWLIMKP